ncbi:MAG: hypothetical protein LC099_02705 [Anaerolineales bacterium]|nr:hypothetical protein [Anaerolineales bacterium]
MSSFQKVALLFALALGVGLGLTYGWVVSPIEYVDAPLSLLREDYRADYVLMIAEAYNADADSAVAARRIAQLGSQPPAEIAASALVYAQMNGFSSDEQALLQNLFSAMQRYAP